MSKKKKNKKIRTTEAAFRSASRRQIVRASQALSRAYLRGALEALVFAAPTPLTIRELSRSTKAKRKDVQEVLRELQGEYESRGIQLREGPHGWGSLQFFVDHDPQIHYLTIQGEYIEQSQQIALFDVIINNADRKSGHVLVDEDDRLWAIDHGLSFHGERKLRSVIWDFAGQPFPEKLREDLVAFQSWLCYGNDPNLKELGQLLDIAEMQALETRLMQLIEDGIFPHPGPGRHYPWPLV